MTIVGDKCYNSSMNKKSYPFTEDALKAIRQHFQERKEARGLKVRITLRKQALGLLPNGDLLYKFVWAGETVKMTVKTYTTEVEF